MELPEEFEIRMKALLGTEYEAFLRSMEKDPVVGVRRNPHKIKADDFLSYPLLHDYFENEVPWDSTGYYLKSRPPFIFDPLLHGGVYYVQDASSMFVGYAAAGLFREPAVCLDVCAAPGGKSTSLLSSLPIGSLLISNETIRSRAGILKENVVKWGNPNCMVTNNDPSDFSSLENLFDLIVADLPCSGEGMFRKNEAAGKDWSPDNVKLCSERQKRIVASVWPSLKEGGWFLYSTCTYNTEENEKNIEWILKNLGGEAVSIPVCPVWNISGNASADFPVYRFFPHQTKGEGFFCCLIEKKGGSNHPVRIKNSDKDRRENRQIDRLIPQKTWLKDPDQFIFERKENLIWALPLVHKRFVSLLESRLNVLYAGIEIGEIKGKNIVPSVSLALSTHLSETAFPIKEANRETALRYLKKEAFTELSFEKKGYNLLAYRNHPLGFINNVGSRANNLYPQEWRIRKSLN